MSNYTMLRTAYLRGIAQAVKETEKTAGIGSTLFNAGRFMLTGGGQFATQGGRIAKFMAPAMIGGTIGGAFNVLGGDPTQPWYVRFGKGYVGGLAGGVGAVALGRTMPGLLSSFGRSGFMKKYAPNLGARLTQATTGGTGLGGRQTLRNIFEATKPAAGAARNWGETAKRVGAWGLAGVPTLGAVVVGDTVAADAAHKIMGNTPPTSYPGAGTMGVASHGVASQYPIYWGMRY